MSGFLHQLAARSLHLAPEVRPRAVLPFAAPTADALAAESGVLPLAPTGLALEPQPPAQPLAKAPARDAEPGIVQPAAAIAGSPAKTPATERPASTDFPAKSAEREPLRILTSQMPHSATPRTGSEAVAHDGEERLAGAPAAPTYLRPEPPPASGNQAADDDRSKHFAGLDDLVSRLLGPQADRSATPPDAGPPPNSRQAPPAAQRSVTISSLRPPSGHERLSTTEADPTPEVHITIGRLEVNSPSRPAPPPPRPRSPAPLSLSDYLARRTGGRS